MKKGNNQSVKLHISVKGLNFGILHTSEWFDLILFHFSKSRVVHRAILLTRACLLWLPLKSFNMSLNVFFETGPKNCCKVTMGTFLILLLDVNAFYVSSEALF